MLYPKESQKWSQGFLCTLGILGGYSDPLLVNKKDLNIEKLNLNNCITAKTFLGEMFAPPHFPINIQ